MERRSLIRLVNQFDRPTVRVSVATPTCCCAGCSSCCCCIVTVSTTAIYTAVHAQRTLYRTAREEPERLSWTPIPGLLGFFAIPIAGICVFLVLALTGSAAAGWFVFFAIWFGAVTLALHLAGSASPWKRAAVIVVLTLVAFVVELFVFAAASGNA